MKYTTVACTLALLSSALAAPGTAARRARNTSRASSLRRTLPNQRVAGSPSTTSSNTTNEDYSNNWGGAVLIGSGYKSVTGTFNAPYPSSDGSGSAWVGIDGDTCSSAILQTGIDWTYSGGSVVYHAWYEWFPDYEYDFDGISINGGDSITVTVSATGTNSGTATVANNSNGGSVTHDFEAQNGDLCFENAEWIVEDFSSNGSPVPFANYGSVTFSGATASGDDGSYDTSSATILDMTSADGNTVLSDCSASGSNVYCTYQ